MKTRCSALPLFVECPSSQQETGAPINSRSVPATMGTAGHEIGAHIVRGGAIHKDLVDDIAIKYSLDREELDFIASRIQYMWTGIKGEFTDPKPEQFVESGRFVGTADVVDQTDYDLKILDWKTGHLRSDYMDQLMGYAHCARETFGMPRSGKIQLLVAWVRDGDVERIDVTDKNLDDWNARVRDLERDIGRTYNPGGHCNYCPRRLVCDAATQWTGNAIAQFTAPGELSIPLSKLHERIKAVEKAVTEAKAMLRAAVESAGEVILPGKKKLELRPATRKALDPQIAIAYLQRNGMTELQIKDALTINTTKVRAMVGKDGMDDLAELGGVKTNTYYKLMKVNQ